MQHKDHSKAEDARQVQSIQVQQAILNKVRKGGWGGKVRQTEGMLVHKHMHKRASQ